MLETNMDIVHTMRDRISYAAPSETDLEKCLDGIMEHVDYSSRVFAWVVAIITIIFVLVPVWFHIYWFK